MSKQNEYLEYYADCYVLTNKRTKEFIHAFLDKFLPNRCEQADEYEIPQYTQNPIVLFNKAEELIIYLEANKNEPYGIYWLNDSNSEINAAECFFTNDGFIIIGLSTKTKYPNTIIEDHAIHLLKEFSDSIYAVILYEQPPPKNSQEFIELINKMRTT